MERILLLEDDKSLVAACAAALAVHGPVKRLQAMSVTAAINEL